MNNTAALFQLPYFSVFVIEAVMKTGLLFLKSSCFPGIFFQPETSALVILLTLPGKCYDITNRRIMTFSNVTGDNNRRTCE